MKTLFATILFCVAASAQLLNGPGTTASGSSSGHGVTIGPAPFATSSQGPFIGENAPCSSTTNSSCFTGSLVDAGAALPINGVYTGMDGTPASGSVVTIPLSSLQATLNAAVCGEVIKVNATASPGVQSVLTANVSFPAKGCSTGNWIWVVTDQYQNQAGGFPAEHVQITPCAANLSSVTGYPDFSSGCTPAFLVPKVVAANSGTQCAFCFAASAGDYRIIGFEVANGAFNNDNNGLIDFSAGGVDSVICDRCLVHGEAPNCTLASGSYSCTGHDLKNAIQLNNSTHIAFISSWVYQVDCPQQTCTDSHAVGGGNGDNPEFGYKFWNDLLEAAGENFFSGGGGDGSVNVTVPSDFDLRHNHFWKPPYLQLQTAGANGCATNCGGPHPEIKNHLEIKNGKRFLIEGNEFENNYMGWATDQLGVSSISGPRNQSNKILVTVTSDGAGNVVATSGSFGTGSNSPIAAGCAVPNHCNLILNNVSYQVQTNVDSTHVTVSPAMPAVTNTQVNQCTPGLNPVAQDSDIVYRFDEFRNTVNGIEVADPPSDCGDKSLGYQRISIHDIVVQGANSNLNNARSPNAIAYGVKVLNEQITNVGQNVTLNHITTAIANSGNGGLSGDSIFGDFTASTTDGTTGSYMVNMSETNDIGPAGGLITYKSGTLYPGGALAGFKQIGCTPPVTGGICSFTFTRNIKGLSQWTGQINNAPFPPLNQQCGNSGNPSATCFPVGANFQNIFVNYNGPSGQPGYLGDYHVQVTSPYSGASTDGKDPGADLTKLGNATSGIRRPLTFSSPVINTTSLATVTAGNTFSFQLSGDTHTTGDFQYWTITSGSITPCGGTLIAAGILAGTAPNVTVSCTFTVQLMDAEQAYDTQVLTLTIQAPSVNNNWVQVPTAAGATQIRDFTFDGSGNLFYVDRLSGVWSTVGGTPHQVNTGLPSVSGVIVGWTITWDPIRGQLILGLAKNGSNFASLWRSSNGGITWISIPIPSTNGDFPGDSGTVNAPNNDLITTVHNGFANSCGLAYSTNGGTTTTAASCTSNGPFPNNGNYGGLYTDTFVNAILLGTEQSGTYASTDNGRTLFPISPNETGFIPGQNIGNVLGICTNSSGTIFVAQQGGLWVSSGTFPTLTWSVIAALHTGTSAGRMCFRDNVGNMYYGHAGDVNDNTVLMQSTDGGLTWHPFQNNLPVGSVGTKGLEAWQMVQNSFDGQLYINLQRGSNNSATIWKTQ